MTKQQLETGRRWLAKNVIGECKCGACTRMYAFLAAYQARLDLNAEFHRAIEADDGSEYEFLPGLDAAHAAEAAAWLALVGAGGEVGDE